eukprot:3875674-Heterocapsa_arctica.AAC.1
MAAHIDVPPGLAWPKQRKPLIHTLFLDLDKDLRPPELRSCRTHSSSAPERIKGASTLTLTSLDADADGAPPRPPPPLSRCQLPVLCVSSS